MSERRYTDENDQPLSANLINSSDFLRQVDDLTHGDVTLSEAIRVIRSHSEHDHHFETSSGMVIVVPALSPRSSKEDLDKMVTDMLDTLYDDIIEVLDKQNPAEKPEPTDG